LSQEVCATVDVPDGIYTQSRLNAARSR
jgi:hypothetical protein